MLLYTEGLDIGYSSKKDKKTPVLENINLHLKEAELVCLLGRNGTGKSTLLRTLSGLQKVLNGKVFIKNKLINNFKKQDLAKVLSLVLTDKVYVQHLRVRDILEMARYPYTGWLGRLKKEDWALVDKSIRLTQIESLIDKSLSDLSDGERQKVMIARALTQDTPIIFLDEPTTHLDFANRVMVFELLAKLVQTQQKSILVSTHEIPLALKYADRILLINEKKQILDKKTGDKALLDEIEKNFGIKGLF